MVQSLKRVRNDAVQKAFLSLRPPHLKRFLQSVESLQGQHVALVVAYEQPWALDWLLKMASRHLSGGVVLVFDNSRRASARMDIERVCQQHTTPYLGLPSNPTRHVNRSHGMAMTWIFHNVMRALKPRSFSFIDHDLIPLENFELGQSLGDQPFYGLPNIGQACWSLWAGYCMYDFAATQHLALNFLNDFPRGLDTGGRNWHCLYSDYERVQLRFAADEQVSIMDAVAGTARPLQVIDKSWVHLSGASYSSEFRQKLEFYERLAKAADAGATLQMLTTQGVPH